VSPPSYRAVRVWDGTIRLTHWWNAIATLLLLALGGILYLRDVFKLPDAVKDTLITVHAAVGFALAAGLAIRIIYLFAEPGKASNWRDLLPHTRTQFELALRTLRYYAGGFKGECPLYFAHNPLAGMAYGAFFVFASMQALTGAAMYLLGDGVAPAYAHEGHFQAPPQTWPPAWLVLIHDVDALLIALFIIAHLAALALHDLVETRGLASSMISGNKFFSDDEIRELDKEKPASDA